MKGITFSPPMILAWLAGRKSVTRRLIRMISRPDCCWCKGETPYEWIDAGELSGYDFRQPCRCIRPRYLPGETVYIKEVWKLDESNDSIVFYKADGQCILHRRETHLSKIWTPGWKSPLFMPAWASRSHALIVSVRPERVQEITSFEAAEEGCPIKEGIVNAHDVLRWFKDLWEALHPRSWEKNEWCWVYKLKRMEEI